jgi:hypothetical protein
VGRPTKAATATGATGATATTGGARPRGAAMETGGAGGAEASAVFKIKVSATHNY